MTRLCAGSTRSSFPGGVCCSSCRHTRRSTKHALRTRLSAAGFTVERLRYVNPLGAVGWFVASRLRKREEVPEGPLKLYDKLVPALRVLDKVDVGVGLSVWAVARRP